MGNSLRRGLRNINIENRAHRFIEKNVGKARSSPRYPSATDDIKRAREVFPQMTQELRQKNATLLHRLRKVKVDSKDIEGKPLDIEKVGNITPGGDRPLPQLRGQRASQNIFVDDVPLGRLSVPQAMQLLAKHQLDKEKWNAERLSQDFKLDIDDTKNIVQYFQAFKVIPQNPNDPHQRLPTDNKGKLTSG